MFARTLALANLTVDVYKPITGYDLDLD